MYYIHHYNTYKPGSKLIEVFFLHYFWIPLIICIIWCWNWTYCTILFIILIKYVSTNTYKQNSHMLSYILSYFINNISKFKMFRFVYFFLSYVLYEKSTQIDKYNLHISMISLVYIFKNFYFQNKILIYIEK